MHGLMSLSQEWVTYYGGGFAIKVSLPSLALSHFLANDDAFCHVKTQHEGSHQM
jgi:hypothetical protein